MTDQGLRRGARLTWLAASVITFGYLAVIAVAPEIRMNLPTGVQWFGRPNSVATLLISVILLIGVAVMLPARRAKPAVIAVGLGLLSAALAIASYWHCADADHPAFFTPITWSLQLVKGGSPEQSLNAGVCPALPPPIALKLAHLAALGAFLSAIGAIADQLRSGTDRLRVRGAHAVTVLVDPDEDARSLIAAVQGNLDPRNTLVILTPDPLRPVIREARAAHHAGSPRAKVIQLDIDHPGELSALRFWSRLDRLDLLSPDPAVNLNRMREIDGIRQRLDSSGSVRLRIPLVVRIDDPWQAAAWRSRQFGGASTENRWAADAVGRYEVTATRLLEAIANESPRVTRIIICGSSPLTLALLAEAAQREMEADFENDGLSASPQLVLLAGDAEEFGFDHRTYRRQLGLPDDIPVVRELSLAPTVPEISRVCEDSPTTDAVILVDAPGLDPTTGTRLAIRHQQLAIYAYSPTVNNLAESLPLMGRLREFRLDLNLPEGKAHDQWERAARLIHTRYANGVTTGTAASRSWEDLDPFFRGSNRRQVATALWTVEAIGQHTWNYSGDPPRESWTALQALRQLSPTEQLARLGFDEPTAWAMAAREHEDWCTYYRTHGWRYGAVRDDAAKVHDKLLTWEEVEADPVLRNAALASLAATLISLRELGYRSRPVADASWRTFTRTGTVSAEQRAHGWTWTSASGETLTAAAGDWEVRETERGPSWSVRDDVFRATYAPAPDGRWARTGTVRARPATPGEVVETLEGPVTAGAGDWLVEGPDGNRWPVATAVFAANYRPTDGA